MALNMETAERLAKAAVARAQELGVKFSVAVVDEAGNLVYLVRMDGAGFLTPQIAAGKAFTAAAFRKSSADMAQAAQARPVFFGGVTSMTDGKALLAQGALPIVMEGKVVGAAGASGGSPDQDEEVVRAGIEAAV